MAMRVDLNKIRQCRNQKGLRQYDVAKALGYKSTTGYHHIETGKRKMSANQLLKLADILGVELADIITSEAKGASKSA